MNNSFSFRPIEYIVMAVLISFSLTITIAVSGNSRKYEEQAECMSKLCKWGAVIHTINDANDGEIPLLRPEMSLYPNLLRCPTTHDDYASPSGPTTTYHLPNMIDTASYGFNYWYVSPHFLNPMTSSVAIQNISDVQDPENVPLMLDSMNLGGWPRHTDVPPVYNGEQSFGSQNDMKKFAMDRHSGGVHVLFVDDSVRRIKVMGLWQLKWHRTFNIAGPWTPAGGMLPSDLPEWLREDN